jgi:hypothetical protein
MKEMYVKAHLHQRVGNVHNAKRWIHIALVAEIDQKDGAIYISPISGQRLRLDSNFVQRNRCKIMYHANLPV